MTRQVTIRLSQKGPNKYFFRNKTNRWRAATRKVCVCFVFSSHNENIFKIFCVKLHSNNLITNLKKN